MSYDESSSPEPRRRRPSRRVAGQGSEEVTSTLDPVFTGKALAYGDTLLFIGYEVNGLVEVVIYPRYRFPSDDRVQGHLGYVRVPYGTAWQDILQQVDHVSESAQENYRMAVALRSADRRAHGARFDGAYDEIADVFRESWHGFSLRLRREGSVEKGGITFAGRPPGPVLATLRDKVYTVQVYPTGSILVVAGDKRDLLGGR